MTFVKLEQRVWDCPCGSLVPVPASRVVPDHQRPNGRWCRFSFCTLTPRAAAGLLPAGAR